MFEICSMNIHYRFFRLEYFFESCAKNGIRNAELWLCPQHLYITASEILADAGKIQSLAAQANVSIRCLCPEQNNPKPNNLAARETHLIEHSLSYFRKVILFAEQLHVPQILMTSGWAYYDEAPCEAWRRSVRHMKQIALFARKHHVKVCLEPLQPHESRLVNNLSSMKQYLTDVDSDNLYVALDMGALGKANEKIWDWFAQFGEQIIHIHYVDGSPTGHLPIGQGTRDIEADMLCLLENDYQGVLSFEFANVRSFENPCQADLDSKNKIQNAIQNAERRLKT